MIRARIVSLATARDGAVAKPLPGSGCGWSSIGISHHDALKLNLRLGEPVDGGGCAHRVERVGRA